MGDKAERKRVHARARARAKLDKAKFRQRDSDAPPEIDLDFDEVTGVLDAVTADFAATAKANHQRVLAALRKGLDTDADDDDDDADDTGVERLDPPVPSGVR